MNLVCLDNHILIWAIKEESTTGQEKIKQAKYLFTQFKENSISVILPALVIAEFLMPVPVNEHTIIINLFDTHFVIAPFDTAAASKFSEIWQVKKDRGVLKKIIESGKTKNEMRIDNLIVATAVVKKAEAIYSEDDGLKAFAQDFIQVLPLPEVPQQPRLPDLL